MSRIQWFSALALSLLSVPAFAHTGVGHTTGFMAGLAHPLRGADHMLAMIAVGLWAAQIGGRAVWAIPAAFVALMLGGGVLGVSGIFLPYVEQGIQASVLILGLLIAGACKLPVASAALIVGCFAIFHGHAHGAEMQSSMGAIPYSLGFALATALLHAGGIAGGMAMRALCCGAVMRLAGVVITFGGAYLAAYA